MPEQNEPGLFADITMQNPMTPEILAELSDKEIDFDEVDLGPATTESAATLEVPTQELPKPLAEPEQNVLFDKGEWWDDHWKGMPSFCQNDLMPFKSVIVHFEDRKDMMDFAKLVDQPIGLKTKSLWFPAAEIGKMCDKRYIDAIEKVEAELSTASEDEDDVEFLDSGDLAS